MPLFRRVLVLFAMAAIGSSVAPTVGHAAFRPPIHSMPNVARSRGRQHANAEPITYHGGPVMTGKVNVYAIWYGDWATRARRRAILTDFMQHLASPYWNINRTFPSASGLVVDAQPVLAGQLDDKGSVGTKQLSDAQIQQVVTSAISRAALPNDPNGIYLVLTSSAVTKAGFLSEYCGWHSYARVGATAIKFGFIGDPSGPKVRSCSPQSVSPNGDTGADAMASTIFHELDETVTDPTMRGWRTARGEENADRCAWQYGKVYKSAGGVANMRLGARDYLIQLNWLNSATPHCAVS